MKRSEFLSFGLGLLWVAFVELSFHLGLCYSKLIYRLELSLNLATNARTNMFCLLSIKIQTLYMHEKFIKLFKYKNNQKQAFPLIFAKLSPRSS